MKQDVSRDTKDVTIQNCSTDTNKQTKLQVMESSVPMIGGGARCLQYLMYGGGTGNSVEVYIPSTGQPHQATVRQEDQTLRQDCQ